MFPCPFQKIDEYVGRPVSSRWVVGVTNKNDLGAPVDLSQHCFRIESKIAQRNQARLNAGKLGHPLVNGKGLVGRDNIIALLAEGLDDSGDHFTRPVADQKTFSGKTEVISQRLT